MSTSRLIAAASLVPWPACACVQVLKDKWYMKGNVLINTLKRKPKVGAGIGIHGMVQQGVGLWLGAAGNPPGAGNDLLGSS